MSVYHEGLLLLKTATVNRDLVFDEVCKDKHVFVANINDPGTFWVRPEYDLFGSKVVQGGTMDESAPQVLPIKRYESIAREWEIQKAFFKYNNITPHWNYTKWQQFNARGTLDNTTGQWDGLVGLIQTDEADYAIFGFSVTHEMSKVAAFSPGTDYSPKHWFTKYPRELTPMWNLFDLFTKGYNSQIRKDNLI